VSKQIIDPWWRRYIADIRDSKLTPYESNKLRKGCRIILYRYRDGQISASDLLRNRVPIQIKRMVVGLGNELVAVLRRAEVSVVVSANGAPLNTSYRAARSLRTLVL
jgi:hypothetical protein